MKTKIWFVHIFIFTFIFSVTSYPQVTEKGKIVIGKDTVILGKNYYLLNPDNAVMPGKIIGYSDKTILFDDGNNVSEVNKSEIVKIFDEYPANFEYVKTPIKSIYKAYWSFGAGFLSPEKGHAYTSGSTYWNAAENLAGFNLFASSTLPFSKFAGGRLELDYSFIRTGDNVSTQDSYHSSVVGGSWNTLAVKFLLGMGNFSDSKFTAQVFLGTGLGIGFKSPATFTLATRYSYDSSFTVKVTDKPAEKWGSLVATITADLRYKVTKKFGLFIEPQINFWFKVPNFVLIRAGVYF